MNYKPLKITNGTSIYYAVTTRKGKDHAIWGNTIVVSDHYTFLIRKTVADTIHTHPNPRNAPCVPVKLLSDTPSRLNFHEYCSLMKAINISKTRLQ